MKNKSQLLNSLLEEMGPKEGAGLLFKHANEVFLVKHSQLKQWVTPGGMREPKDDELKTTALREFREEIGMLPGYADTGRGVVTEDKSGIKYTTFLYEPDHRFIPTKLDEESTEAQWFDFEKLPTDIYEPTKRAIKEFGFVRAVKPRGWK